jgi:HSP20 family protein
MSSPKTGEAKVKGGAGMFDLLKQDRLGWLRGEMDQLFRSHFGELWSGEGNGHAWGFPSMNLWEDADHLYAEAEIPGMKAEEIELSISGDELTLKGERREPKAEGSTWHRRERPFGAFVRTVTLPVAVDGDKVEASFRHGVLTVTLPKAEAVRPRRIQVKSEDVK